MKNLSINLVGEICNKYVQPKAPKAPKGSQSFFKHFYDKYKKYVPKNKLIIN